MSDTLILHRITAIDPDRVALKSAHETVTYGELDRRAVGLAQQLQAAGITTGSTVAVAMPRGVAQIVALVAASYAGAAFVPMDITWPEERMEYILKDSGAAVLIAQKEVSGRLKTQAIAMEPDVAAGSVSTDDFTIDAKPADIAYVIYTSGSTGVPKGCEITHANLRHLVEWHNAAFAVTSNDRASHMAGLGFDASVWEVWPYLAAGACVCLVDEDLRTDATRLQSWFEAEEIDICFVPTPLAEILIAMPWASTVKLRTMLTGGDTLHSAPAAALPFQLVNNYGPTECTVVATSGIVRAGVAGLPSIGRVIAGATGYILDEQGNRVAEGEEGELYVGGNGVGAGYRNLPEQTRERFLLDPFSNVPGARMYRTGDRVKALADGEMAFIGRADNQVKIRGYRIELEEISNVMNRHAAVKFSVVVPSTEPGTEHLIAYVMPSDDGMVSARELQEFLGSSLPQYMVPAQFVQITELPLTSNGKVNRAVLPAPSAANALPETVEARSEMTEVEAALLELVRASLHNNEVTIDDDFFLVGGHSLMGTQIVLRVRETFGIELSLADLFEAGTVAFLAARIEELMLEQLDSMSDEEAARLMGIEQK